MAYENYVSGWTVSAKDLSVRRASATDTDTGNDWENSNSLGDPGFGNYAPSTPDTTPPVVTITNPTASTISGSVIISMSVTDASAIVQNEIYIDNTLRASSPSYNWDTTLELDTAYTIKARAMDSSNNWGEAIFSVTVDNTNYVPPTLSEMKIMAYNVEQSGLNPDWKQVVKEENADIAIFIETGDWDTNGVFESYISEFNTYFTTEDPYYGAQTTGIAFSTSGEAIMSRYPIVSVTQIPLVTLDDGSSFDPSHDFLSVELDIPGTNMYVVASHLKCCSGATNENKRERAQEGIINYIDSLGDVPVVYAGDLNSFSPEDVGPLAPNGDLNYGPMSMMLKDDTFGAYSQYGSTVHTFVDSFRTMNPNDPGYTYGHQNPTFTSRIDFLTLNQHLYDKMISATVGDTPTANTGSDHYSTDVTLNFATTNDTTAPTQVTGLVTTTVSNTQIDLTWSVATDDTAVTGYNIYRDGVLLTSTTGTSYSDTGLSSLTTYSYQISASDAAGNEGIRSISSSSTTLADPDTTPPTQVTGLSTTVIGTTQIDLTWSASTDNIAVAGYNIYRDGVFITSTPTTSYSDTGVTEASTYSYQISAFDAAGNEGLASNSVSVSTPDISAPTQVTGLVATTISDTQIDLLWSASTDNLAVAGYNIYRDGVLLTSTTGTSYSDMGLSSLTTYSYQISAFDTAGNEGLLSNSVSSTTNAPPSGNSILIYEVYYDTIGRDSIEEWIELYNYGNTAVDLSGWTISDNSGTYTIAQGVILQPGKYLVIARDNNGFFNLYGFNPDIADLSLALGNKGDMLTLKDTASQIIDFVAWENYVSGWNIVAKRGQTISRTSIVDTDTVTDWIVKLNNGTPINNLNIAMIPISTKN